MHQLVVQAIHWCAGTYIAPAHHTIRFVNHDSAGPIRYIRYCMHIVLQAYVEAGGACWLKIGESCAVFCDSGHSMDQISAWSHITGLNLCVGTNRAGIRPQTLSQRMGLGEKGRHAHQALYFSLAYSIQGRVIMFMLVSCMWLL